MLWVFKLVNVIFCIGLDVLSISWLLGCSVCDIVVVICSLVVNGCVVSCF